MAVVEAEVVVRNKLGVHTRPAAQICRIVNRFQCEVSLRSPRSVMLGSAPVSASIEPDAVNARSIMDIMSGAFSVGSHVVIHADGDDAAEAVAALVELFEGEFGEE